MEVQKQLQEMGVPSKAAKKVSEFAKANGISLVDILSHLPEILAFVQSAGDLWGKLFKGSSQPLSMKRSR